MSLVTVKAKELGLGNFNVKTTNRNVRYALKTQLELAKINRDIAAAANVDAEDMDTVIKTLEAQEKLVEVEIAFLVGISPKSVTREKIENADFDKMNDIVLDAISRILGYDQNKSSK